MKNFKLYLAALLVVGFAGFAYADGYDLTNKRIQELPTLSAASIASGDLVPVWDSSANQFVSVDATTLPLGGAFNGTLGAVTPAAATVTNLAATGTLTIDTVLQNIKAYTLLGRADVTVCGDGTTINNNTIFYGPSQVPVANGIRTCDTTQAGNATEATAEHIAFDAKAFQVLSMNCLTADPGAAGVSFTLRTAGGATVPSITCSVANGGHDCETNAGTTTAIASGAKISIAAASTGDQGTTPFSCVLKIAY